MRHARPGRLRLVDPIGEGGAGSVWRAWDPHRRRFVAVKLLPRDGLAPAGSVHEQSVRLDHPHVVLPREWRDDTRAPALVMDLVRGGTADQLLAEHGSLPEDYVVVLLEQLLRALEAVHAAGLVHRDVKPANLLLEPTGSGRPHVRLGDFGVALLIGGAQPAAEIPGTDGYLAPELFMGVGPGPRQDLYAAGVTAAELLTGHIPRSSRDLPRGPLRRLLTDLTDPDPDRRPPTAATALYRLRAYGVPQGAPWTDRPHPPVVPDRFGDLRSPLGPGTWVALAGLACAVALCLAALLS